MAFAQDHPRPYRMAREATEWFQNKTERKDSLKKIFMGKISLDLYYGQRYISTSNHADYPDTLTFTDFSESRGYFGLGGSYFLTDRVMLGGTINILMLPKKQDINSVSGSGGSGTGSGGLSINFELLGRYHFAEWGNTRPYFSLGLGRYQLIAKGGNVEFSFSSGRNDDIDENNAQYWSSSLSCGISHRLAPGSIFDVNFGYTATEKKEPIGGITSPGGINSSVSIRFILNNKKY